MDTAKPTPTPQSPGSPPKRRFVPVVVAEPALPRLGHASKATCPYLGLSQDRSTHFTFPQGDHVCYATKKPGPIDEAFQGSHCLGFEYPECRRYVAAQGPGPSAPPAAGHASIEPGRRRTWHLPAVGGLQVIRAAFAVALAIVALFVIVQFLGLVGGVLFPSLSDGSLAPTVSQGPIGGGGAVPPVLPSASAP